MSYARSGLKPVLASTVILVLLLSGGIFAYATRVQPTGAGPAYEGSQTSTSATSSTPGGSEATYLKFDLIAFPDWQHQTVPDNYPFEEGLALLYLSPGQPSLKLTFSGAPNATFNAVLQENGQSNITVGTATTDQYGKGYASIGLTLAPGIHEFGILLFATTSSGQNDLVAVSDPRSASVTIPVAGTTTTETSTTETSEAETSNTQHEGAHAQYQLVSLPEYLLTAQPSNYPFTKGAASIDVMADSMSVMVSFLGAPNTNFTIVLQRNGANLTLGNVTTNDNGGGALRKQLSIVPGTYELGFLIFAVGSDGTSSLVGVSIPRTQTLTAPSVTETSTSTSTETESENSIHGGAEFKFNPTPGASVPGGYSFGQGTATVEIQNSAMVVNAEFQGQKPDTTYALVVTVNGTMHRVGEYKTDAHGDGHIATELVSGSGTFAIGLSVYDLSSFSAATLVLSSEPATTILFTSHGVSSTSSTTESQSETESSVQSGNHGEHELKFRVVSVQVQNAPANYSQGRGEANVQILGQILRLNMEIEHAAPTTQFNVALSVNGTSTKIGQLATNHEGDGEIVAELKLDPGTYLIGVLVYDVSNFQAPTLVMASDPTSISAVVVASGNHRSTSVSESESESRSVTTIQAGKEIEANIKLAVSSLAIPAVVHVGSGGTSFSVLDSRFSVSVGKAAENGLIISISATNVTGPKVLLLNLTQDAFLNVYSHPLNVTLDGNPVAQASSVTQVLNPSPGDPARYVIVSASTGFQLLISIPHFSTHTIQIIPIPISQVQRFLAVNAEVLAVSVAVITVLFAALYRTRQKLFSLFL